MTLAQMKQGQPYRHTSCFLSTLDQFRRLVESFVVACANGYLKYFISQDTMSNYPQTGTVFENFLDAIEAIDVTFQKLCVRGKDYQSKKCWSRKHKGYRWKTKMAVGSDGKVRYVLPPYLGLCHTHEHTFLVLSRTTLIPARAMTLLSITTMKRTCGQRCLTRATRGQPSTGIL